MTKNGETGFKEKQQKDKNPLFTKRSLLGSRSDIGIY